PHGVTERLKLARPMMRGRAGLNPDETRRKLLKERNTMPAPELTANDHVPPPRRRRGPERSTSQYRDQSSRPCACPTPPNLSRPIGDYFNGTNVPVEEPSTASETDSLGYFSTGVGWVSWSARWATAAVAASASPAICAVGNANLITLASNAFLIMARACRRMTEFPPGKVILFSRICNAKSPSASKPCIFNGSMISGANSRSFAKSRPICLISSAVRKPISERTLPTWLQSPSEDNLLIVPPHNASERPSASSHCETIAS